MITELIGELGIRIYKANFGTDKISGICTNFLEKRYGSEIEEPVIVLNEIYCNTPERYLKEVAKQFYYMIAKPNEFDYQEENGIRFEMRSTQMEAEKFAEELFISTEYLNAWIKKNRRMQFVPIIPKGQKESYFEVLRFNSIINDIKHVFYIDYRTAIKKLLESDWDNKNLFEDYDEAEAFYLECLKKHDKEYENKTKWLNGEPDPLPWEYTDFIANKQYIL